MPANRLPTSDAVAFRFVVTRLPLRGQYRVLTGFPFHLPPIKIDIESAAKHLTTSPTMLTAAKAIGKRQTQADSIERLIN
jgi:hypothetical protein